MLLKTPQGKRYHKLKIQLAPGNRSILNRQSGSSRVTDTHRDLRDNGLGDLKKFNLKIITR